MVAAASGCGSAVEIILHASPLCDINAADYEDGVTSLIAASEKNHFSIVQLLVNEKELQLNVKTLKFGKTALMKAATKGYTGLGRLLLSRRSDIKINAQAHNGDTALHIAAYFGHPGFVELLLNAGADRSSFNKRGLTPWHYAQRHVNSLPTMVGELRPDLSRKFLEGR